MSARNLLIVLGLVASVAGVYYLRIWLGWESDLRSRPWAYSRDPGAKLLVGKWTGSFRDPGGVDKTIILTIDEPVSWEKREDQASRRRKKSMGALKSNKQAFGGTSTITSQLGSEVYDVSGSVRREDFQQFQFRFITEGESPHIYPNHTAAEAVQGAWRGDEITLTVRFQQSQAAGSTTSSSSGTVIDGKLVWEEEARPEVPVRLKRSGTP